MVRYESRNLKVAVGAQSAPPKVSKAQGKEKCAESM
jgi:hypothetical protein